MENLWLFLLLVVAAILCAYRMIVSTRILVATLYLACISALVSILLYLLGGTQVAAIELSVGAGLVTVLLVYAISVVGDDALDPASIVPKPLAMISVLAAAVFLAWLAIPIGVASRPLPAVSMQVVLWEQRVLDLWIQMVLIISGVMGMLGILAEGKTRQRSGLHTLVEVRGQVPQSDEYKQVMEDTIPNHRNEKVSMKSIPNQVETQDGKLDERV
jgi:uncharacterized MnhB-related membrane protein